MNKQYLIRVADSANTSILKEYATILHVTKLKSLVIVQTSDENAEKLKSNPSILSIRPAREGKLASCY